MSLDRLAEASESAERARRVEIMSQRLIDGYDIWGGELKINAEEHKFILKSFNPKWRQLKKNK